MARIKYVDVYPVRLPILRTFEFASGTAGHAGDTAPHVFVRIQDDEGHTGWGEGRPVPQWSYETLESVSTTIRNYLAPAIQDLSVHDRWGLHQSMHAAVGRGPSTGQPIAKAAVDMAVHDLAAQAAGLSLREFLGGAANRDRMELSYTLTAKDVSAMHEDLDAGISAGFRHFNFKVGVAPELDQTLAAVIRETVQNDGFVWADANQGLSLYAARAVAEGLAAIGVDVLEQPLAADQLQQMRNLRQSTRMPLAVDEASVSPSDFFHYAAEGLVDYLVVKITRSGGIWPTLQQFGIAAGAGLPILVSGLTDSFLTKIAVSQVALAFGFSGPAALNGSQFTDDTFLFSAKAGLERDGAVTMPDDTGIGVAPDENALRDYTVSI